MGEHTATASSYAASVIQSLMSSVREGAPGQGLGPGLRSAPHSHVSAGGSFRGRGRETVQGNGTGQGMLHVHVPSPTRATRGGYPSPGSLPEEHQSEAGVGVVSNVSSSNSLSNSPEQHQHHNHRQQQQQQQQPATSPGNLSGDNLDASNNHHNNHHADGFDLDGGLDHSNKGGENYLAKQHFMPVAPPPLTYSTLTAATTTPSVTQAVLNMGEEGDEDGLHIGEDDDDDDVDGQRFEDKGYSQNKMLAEHLRTLEGGGNPATATAAAAPELVGLFSVHSNNKSASAATQEEEDTPGYTTLHLQGSSSPTHSYLPPF